MNMAASPPPPHFLDIGYAPSRACTVGCTWLMYSLCMAHIWPMYDLHMAHTLATYGNMRAGDLSPVICWTDNDSIQPWLTLVKVSFGGSNPDFRGSRELNQRLGRSGEGQGGPNKGHLDQQS